MGWLVKVFGLLIILTTCTLLGFLKSYGLKKNYNKLNDLYRQMSDIRERIRIKSGEITRLLTDSFGDNVIIKNGNFYINESELEKDEINLLNEFLDNIGMSDSESEYERIGVYMKMVSLKCNESKNKCSDLCRLYNTIGFLTGIFICIFFL